ncbi:hypothetical protein GOV11_00140 [Candidatus Woesearchaeota archaeon]|nr:hypothetical protein [Candidatus Woesearchaeota archaeon]
MRLGDISMGALVSIVLISTLIILSVLVIIGMSRNFTDYLKDNECADDIILHYSLADLTGNYGNLKIECPTRYHSLDEPTAKQANALIAEEMQHCWRLWGRGTYELFGDEEGVFCHVCSVITTPGLPYIEGLPVYLQENKANSGESYFDYLMGVEVGQDLDDSEVARHANDRMATDKGTVIIFYYARGIKGFDRIMLNTAGNPWFGLAAGGVLAGVVVTQVGLPIPLAVAASAGGTGGTIMSFFSRESIMENADIMSGIVARPMDYEDILELGCTQAPVEEKQKP